MFKNHYDISNKKFGMLTAIERDCSKNYKIAMWKCFCDCGKIKIISKNSLINGKTKSCGCNQYSHCTKHGATKTKLYKKWRSMINRCYNKKMSSYKNYGERGIEVCNEWKTNFISFKNWCDSNNYKDGMTIDRIDFNGNYEPSNCRLCDWIMQANNKRNNKRITHNGETKTLSEWAKYAGIDYSSFQKRIYSKTMDFKTAISKEKQKSSTGIKNIYFHKESKKYRVQKKVGKKAVSYGSFNTLEEAKEVLKKINKAGD